MIHLRGAFSSYPDRLFPYPQSVLKGEPAVATDGIYFVRMPGQIPGFEVSRWAGQITDPLIPSKDQFHPTVSSVASDLWLEDSGESSNIIRISGGSAAGGAKTEVVDGEQPSVSPDGKWLLFIRESKGRGALWIKSLAPPEGSREPLERKLVEDSQDVWEAAVEPSDQRVEFTAAPHGQPELYALDLNSGLISKLPFPDPSRYPAISPDGKWIAFSHFEGDVWHLFVASVRSSEFQRITQADCNSISPAWEADSQSLVYASDCGRGLEMTTLVRARFDGAGGR
jgi:hypothetical protein